MTLGYIVAWISFILSLAAIGAFIMGGRSQGWLRYARFAYWGAFAFILATEAVLQYLLINGRYDINYVFNFSEKSLSLWYKIAGAWAGQEGSFLLWTIWTAFYGLLVMHSSGSYQRWVMIVFSSIVACLTGILAFQSPFALTPPPPENAPFLQANFPPKDGLGLNASLENIWMTIHPPIIFAGFAALTIPFAFAVAALLRNEYHEWVARARPWAIYASTMLGFGLVLGGYWAYETLGWGGFWAWDPVENSSYFPWLFMAATVHGMILQVNRGKMARWNPLLAALPFLLFIYGTYLTRSGALAEVSVHSFVNLDNAALNVLKFMMFGGVLGVFGLWLYRWRQMPKPQSLDKVSGLSRQSAIQVGIWMLVISAVISLIGTSWPLVTKMIKGEPVALKPDFYNQVHAPWVLLTAVLMATAPFLGWRGMKLDTLLERLTKAWLVALIAAFGIYFAGFKEPVSLLAVTLLVFTAAANFGAIWRRVRIEKIQASGLGIVLLKAALFTVLTVGIIYGMGNREPAQLLVFSAIAFVSAMTLGAVYRRIQAGRWTAGGFLTHMGLAIGLIGLILSNAYEVKKDVIIPEGSVINEFGYRWRYLSMTGDAEKFGDPTADKFNRVRVEVANHEEKFIAEPRFYRDQRRADNNSVVWPWIRRWWDHDLYVSFMAPPQLVVEPLRAELSKNEQTTVGDYTIKFLGFRADGSMGQDGFKAVASVEVNKKGWDRPVTLEPARMVMQQRLTPVPARLPDNAMLAIGGMDVNQGQVMLEVTFVPGRNETIPRLVIPLEVYYKPFTILVWLGPPLALIGGLMAAFRRSRDGRHMLAKLSPASAASAQQTVRAGQ